jgi:hypothetical protein
MRYRLATRQAQDRQEVARLLGGHRHTIGRGLARYAAGGLEALRAPDVPPGHPVSRAPAVLASPAQVLRRPAGVASYEALRQRVAQTHGVPIPDKTLSTVVRTRLKTKRTGPRPRHPKTS